MRSGKVAACTSGMHIGRAHQMIDNHGAFLLIAALIAVVALVVLIARFKINPFIVLMTMSLALAAVSGMPMQSIVDRKSTRLNSSHANISYAVFCLKKKTKQSNPPSSR